MIIINTRERERYRAAFFKRSQRAGEGQHKVYTIDVAGGIGSPRHYGGVSKEQPLLSPSHSHSTCPGTPTHNQHNTTNTHYSSQPPPPPPPTQQQQPPQQHNPMLYHSNANTINPADMQNSQFCYDRSSVPLYPPGGEAQDARSLPPGNPVNHQIGGKSCDFIMSCDVVPPSRNPLRYLQDMTNQDRIIERYHRQPVVPNNRYRPINDSNNRYHRVNGDNNRYYYYYRPY